MNYHYGYMLSTILIAITAVGISHAQENPLPVDDWWTTPEFQDGSRLEFIKGYCEFHKSRGEREVFGKIVFEDREILQASVYLTGFNMMYTEGVDHRVLKSRVDIWVNEIWINDPVNNPWDHVYGSTLQLKLRYGMEDEDTQNSDDYNNAWIGFNVIALTRPL